VLRSGRACSIRVYTPAFEQIQPVLSKQKSPKLFVFNNARWSESHPLRHSNVVNSGDIGNRSSSLLTAQARPKRRSDDDGRAAQACDLAVLARPTTSGPSALGATEKRGWEIVPTHHIDAHVPRHRRLSARFCVATAVSLRRRPDRKILQHAAGQSRTVAPTCRYFVITDGELLRVTPASATTR
jgi:hypothetical protein